MPTASRTRLAPGTGRRLPSRSSRVRAMFATWFVPALAGAVAVGAAVLGTAELVALPGALAATILALLLVVLFVGLRPLVPPGGAPRSRVLGAAFGLAWLVAAYAPFHLRLFPGAALLPTTDVTAAGGGLPLRIPATGRRAVELVLEGHLTPPADGGAAPPVHYTVRVEDGSGAAQTLTGMFEDTLRSRRLGRRGSAVVHHLHAASRYLLRNPAGQDLTVTQVVLEPATAAPVGVSVYPHPLPGPVVLGLATGVLLAAVVAWDRLGPVTATDGALTLATGAIVGSALIFWTSDAVRPDFQTLIGAAIFGGPLGFAVGGALWWVAKRVVARAA